MRAGVSTRLLESTTALGGRAGGCLLCLFKFPCLPAFATIRGSGLVSLVGVCFDGHGGGRAVSLLTVLRSAAPAVRPPAGVTRVDAVVGFEALGRKLGFGM